MTPRSCCAAASHARRCGCRSSAASGPSSGTRGSTPRCARCRAPGSSTSPPSPRPSGSPATCLRGTPSPPTRASSTPPHGSRSRTSSGANRAQGRRRDVGARHGLRQARPGLLRARGLTRLSRRLLPAGRPGGARHRQRRGGAAPGRDRRAHLGVLRDRGGARPGERRTGARRAASAPESR